MTGHIVELHNLNELASCLRGNGDIRHVVIQGVDINPVASEIAHVDVTGTVFLGCEMSQAISHVLLENGALLFPKLRGIPYQPYRAELYTPQELFDGFNPAEPESYAATPDARIYAHAIATGKCAPSSILEALARHLHDHAIEEALQEYLAPYDETRIVGIMGGHALKRTDASYREIVKVGQALTQNDYLPTTGGGPGAMEAIHLGAGMAYHNEPRLMQAIDMLACAPTFRESQWLPSAYRVIDHFGLHESEGLSLGVPTWLYGNEPPTPFASGIAKYFSNSLREESLVTIALGGIIFTPGSAGTLQEVFQDAAQNHYGTPGMISPMIFLGHDFWTKEKPIYPIIKELAGGRRYDAFVTVADTTDEVISFLKSHPPMPV
jgi:predicted Rossmann-fold nucleotide-binding protein